MPSNLLQSLKNSFKAAKRYEKKLRNEGWIHTKRLSWILFIGEKWTGKSSLLRDSEVVKPFPVDENNSENNIIKWWFGRDSVFLEVDMDYFFSQPASDQQNKVWKKFLSLSKKYHQNLPFDGITIIINSQFFLPSQKSKIKNLSQIINRHLFSLEKNSRNIKIAFIFTQCDYLNGFIDYFDDLDAQELKQSFGFDFPSRETKSTNTFQRLIFEFDALIKKVSNRFILRLHQEENTLKRNSLSNFPFLFELFCRKILVFFSNLSWVNKNLMGVYFTSSLQDKSTGKLLENLLEPYGSMKPSTFGTKIKSRTYFVNHTIERIKNIVLNTRQKTQWGRIVALTIFAILISLFTWLWHIGYQESIQTINLVKNNLNPELNRIDALKNTLSSIEQPTVHFPKWVGFNQITEINAQLKQAYKNELISSFQPYLLKTLENEISKSLSANQVALYSALRIYLMLNSPSHYDQDAIQQWFMMQWREQFSDNPSLQEKLASYLNDLLSIKTLKWSVNSELIQQAQNSLKQLSLSELAFLELQEKYKPINVSVLPQATKEKVIDLSNAKIPFFYSENTFSDVYNNAIPNIDKTLLKGNWVLGTEKGIELTAEQKQKLIADVRALYLKYYTQTWQEIIPSILLKTPTDLDQAENLIEMLLDPNSDFNQLLKIVVGNANLAPKADVRFNDVINFVSQKGNTSQIKSQLNSLLNYLQKIKSSSDPLKASFTATADRFSKNGKNDPIENLLELSNQMNDPMRSWLHTIAMGSWQILLSNTRQYLNQLWTTSVFAPYEKTIQNRYPIFKKATDEISLKDFTHFFGPNGTVQSFFENYLQPFVNIATNYWTWNSVDNKTLGIPQSTLDELLRASLIQQMFFTDNQSRPSFRFNLVPTALSSNLISLSLNLSNQVFDITAGKQLIKTFEWPGNSPYFVKLTFTSSDKKTFNNDFAGAWSWFKLLDQSDLKNTTNPKQFSLLIKQNNFQAQFQIYADNLINPFIPGILDKFRCPHQL